MENENIGRTQGFVLARDLCQIDGLWALTSADGQMRFFMELNADPDRPEVRPDQAYAQLLSSMQPGWTLRLLRVTWPDPAPRQAFREQMADWGEPGTDGLSLLFDGLALFVQSAPLPYERCTILEFSTPEIGKPEALAWWQSLPHLLRGYGFQAVFLDGDAILEFARWMFNPKFG